MRTSKKPLIWLLLILCLALTAGLACAETSLTFTKGIRLDLFEQDGVSAYLTGEVEDSGLSMISFPAVIVNNSDKAVCVSWHGTGNGWTISRGVFGNSGSNVAPHSKAKTFFWLQYEELDIKRFAQLENVVLDFVVEEPYEGFIPTNNTYFTVSGITINFQGDTNAARELVYFEESPSLPVPTSYVDVYQSGHSSSTVNKKVTNLSYRYRPVSSQDQASDMLNGYVEGLKNAGYAVSGSGSSYTVKNGKTKVATLSMNNDQIVVEIVPGNTKLKAPTPKVTQAPAQKTQPAATAAPAPAADTANPFHLTEEQAARAAEYGYSIPTTQEELDMLAAAGIIDPATLPAAEPVYAEDGSIISANAPEETEERYHIGDTLKADTVSLQLVKQGTTGVLNSYLGKKPKYWFHYDAQDGSQFLYIQAKFTNNGSRAVDINRLYLEAEFDGIYYDGSAAALLANGQAFETDVDPRKSVDCYLYFEVPNSVLNSYKNCIVRIGVDNSFGIKIRKNGGYNFEICDSVFEVDLSRQTGKSFSFSTSKSATAAPSVKTTEAPTAPAAYDKPITFQNIPWGSTPDKARAGLVKAGMIKSKGAVSGSHHAVFGSLYSGDFKNPTVLIHTYDRVLYEDWLSDSKIKKKIAGYTVDNMSLDYVYSISKGKLNKKKQALVSVNIQLKVTDEETAMADLTAKLESIYGPCAGSGYMCKVWLGADDTCVVLYSLFSPTLLYAKTDNLSVVSQMYEELGYTIDASDTAGL